MRPGMLLTLAGTWVVVMTPTEPSAGAVPTGADRTGNAATSASTLKRSSLYPVLKIEGEWKTTSQEAWQSAEAKTRAALIEYRQSAGASLERVPHQKLRPLLARYWKPTETSQWFIEPVGRQMHRFEVRVPLSARLLQELEQLENEEGRKQLAEQRSLMLAKVLGGLVLFLTAAACYFRLDDWTKGYYTTLLRLGTAGVIGTGVATLLLVA